MIIVFVVLYFYPEGTFAGVVGGRHDREAADGLITEMRLTGYSDCTFTVCEVEVPA